MAMQVSPEAAGMAKQLMGVKKSYGGISGTLKKSAGKITWKALNFL
jgi:hypothetical protein